MVTKTSSPTRVVTGKVRLSYVHLFEPWKSEGTEGDAKYSCVILIPKSDKKTLGDIRRAIQAAAEAGASKHFGGKVPKNLSTTLRDGDDDENVDTDDSPEYAGHMFMNVGSKTRPGLVDKNVQPILDSTEIYSGCYARVDMNAFSYSVSGNRGISFGLNHVQKWSDGEYLGGRSRAEDAFDALDDEDEDDLI